MPTTTETHEESENLQTCLFCDNIEEIESEFLPIDGSVACSNCIVECYRCCTTVTRDYSITSTITDETYCDSCADRVLIFCSNCSEETSQCDSYSIGRGRVCQSCLDDNYSYCDGCEEYTQDGTQYADDDDQNLCDSCYESYLDSRSCDDDDDSNDDSCYSFHDYTENETDTILGYNCKPHIKFYDTPLDDSSKLYMGLELELNFNTSNFDTINAITRKYLPYQYVYKYDGSIGEGAELVTCPLTYKALKKINFKEFFKELKSEGVTSYESGKCGLHVHISDNSLDCHNNHTIFYHATARQILKFSQRTEDQINAWAKCCECNLGYYNSNRYSAVNNTRFTNEFRAFRGTINYKRFKTTLIFVHALHHFLKGKKPKHLIKKPPTWDEFLGFLSFNKNYSYLYSYLIDKNIR